MSSSLKPIHVWTHASGPNSWKVHFVCEELVIPYEVEYVNGMELHTPKYEQYNPNGRAPFIHDPNTNLTLWESGAIVKYLADTYDSSHKISFSTPNESALSMQYLMFQMSGQGPYFGQSAWFNNYHPTKHQDVIERYVIEIKRVTKVLDGILEKESQKNGAELALVGGKITYADLAYIPWYEITKGYLGIDFEELMKENPNVAKWLNAMVARPSVQKALKDREVQVAATKH